MRKKERAWNLTDTIQSALLAQMAARGIDVVEKKGIAALEREMGFAPNEVQSHLSRYLRPIEPSIPRSGDKTWAAIALFLGADQNDMRILSGNSDDARQEARRQQLRAR